MDWKQITGLVVGVVIGALLLVSIVVPVIDSATATEKTFENDGIYYIESEGEHTVTLATGNSITVDDVSFVIPIGKEYTVFASDDLLIRTNTGGTAYQLRGSVIAGSADIQFTISDGTVAGTYVATGSESPTSFSKTYTGFILATNEITEAVMLPYERDAAYVNGDSPIMGRGLTNLISPGNDFRYIQFNGTIDDGITIEPITGYTFSTPTINYTQVNGYEDLYAITSITFTATYTDSSPVNVTYTAFIVPSEVTAELSQHLDSNSIAIMQIIPLLITVGIIMAVVGVFVMRRE